MPSDAAPIACVGGPYDGHSLPIAVVVHRPAHVVIGGAEIYYVADVHGAGVRYVWGPLWRPSRPRTPGEFRERFETEPI